MNNGFQIIETKNIKILKSPKYNYSFNKERGTKNTGFFARWGATMNDDPIWSDFGPEIIDMEVTTRCEGVRDHKGVRKVCKFCYKDNDCNYAKNMTINNFRKIFNKLPRTVTQIAFGADSQATGNPALFDMMHYCRDNKYQEIFPNITVADINQNTANKLMELCDAVAVSCYMDRDKNVCYDIVETLSQKIPQVNIHMMLSRETLEYTKTLFEDYKTDKRLSKLNAIVLLSLKCKGRGLNYHPLKQPDFDTLTRLAIVNRVPIGFDSCSCSKFLNVIRYDEKYKILTSMCEPCESGLFSAYINADGDFYPCSFMEGVDDWWRGLSVLKANDFIEDIWMNDKTEDWRNKLLKNVDLHGIRKCPFYDI